LRPYAGRSDVHHSGKLLKAYREDVVCNVLTSVLASKLEQ